MCVKVLWLQHTVGSKFIIWPEGHSKAGQVIPDSPHFERQQCSQRWSHLMSGLVFGKGYRLALDLQVALTKSCL